MEAPTDTAPTWQGAFLEALKLLGTTKAACNAAGVNSFDVAQEKVLNPDFKAACSKIEDARLRAALDTHFAAARESQQPSSGQHDLPPQHNLHPSTKPAFGRSRRLTSAPEPPAE